MLEPSLLGRVARCVGLALVIGRAGVAAAEPPVTAVENAAELDRVLEVAGLRLHLHCEGHGSPTVVFDSGAGSDGSAWRNVQPGVARITRACAYDRAGLGYSGPGRKPRTSDRMAHELHALLAAADLPPPYVLVGHSAGGLNIRLFASDHPGEVVGMVLVDATPGPAGKRLWSLMSSEETRQMRDRMRRGPDGWDYDSLIESMQRVAETPGLGDLPLVVLTAGRDDPPPGVSPEDAARRFAVWQELQAESARLSTQSRHVVVPEARHFIQWDAPAAVVGAVRDVVMAARSGRRLEGAAGAPAPVSMEATSLDAAAPRPSEPVPNVASSPSPAAASPIAAQARVAPTRDTSPASAHTLWQRFREGGLTMFALLGLSTLALATTLERSVGFREKRVLDRALFEQAEALWSAGRFAELEELCRKNESVAARIVDAVVRHRTQTYSDVSTIAGEIASGALREHLRRTYWLSVVATLGPLLGLFGTVVGMVEAFDAIAASGAMGDPALVATGISKALVTTAAGLLVGIPALGARHFFQTRIHRVAAELESETNDLVRRWLLKERTQP